MVKKIKKHLKNKKGINQERFYLEDVPELTGFSMNYALPGEKVTVLGRAAIISDQSEFYTYIDEISRIFLSRLQINPSQVYQLLIIIHPDNNAHIYVNNFLVSFEMLAKRDLKKGEAVGINDIADIKELTFPDIVINEEDRIIYCFKVGWKFGLFFDFHGDAKLSIENMSLTLGKLFRYLSFQHVYKIFETESSFNSLLEDGWFPFIELISDEFKELSSIYEKKFDFENRVNKIVDKFNAERIRKIVDKWWKKDIFEEKRSILEAGVKAFLRNDEDGFITCIKTLITEAEGILRLHYFKEQKKVAKNINELLEYIVEKGKTKTGADFSLPLPQPFFRYLKEVIFASFCLEDDKLKLSRHSASHGVAKATDYTKMKALQMILVLDQFYFYL